ncbi:AMP-dependent synthetase/ligase [Paraburkholderia unamae]|uniref:Long-chain acyl-CoA synthetase n=1 Tax=Paraburkholderia unamae TaxID=219649 RepID=A0ABX5K996_9BURK|nr:AMP-binding protein [Paraburkholderia unamae]PVX61405.1 long-chain acyl-CoA synthetase [Paraburkholderia unamae]
MTAAPWTSGSQFATTTIPALLIERVKSNAEANAFFQKRAGEWIPTTWKGYANAVCSVSAALREVGVARGERIAIMGDVSQEWVIADMATICSGAVTVGVYFTASVEEVRYYLEDSGARLAFAGSAEQLRIMEAADTSHRLLKIVVLDPGWKSAPGETGTNVVSLAEFALHFAGDEVAYLREQSELAKSTDLVSLGYTSGTTGAPKGAMLTHLSMLAGAFTWPTFCPAILSEPQRMVIHLPLSHTVARIQAMTLPLMAKTVSYFVDVSADFAKCIQEVRPTSYMAPPRFYQKFATQIINHVNGCSEAEQRNYKLALGIAREVLADRLDAGSSDPFKEQLYTICRELIFKPLLARIGFDDLRYPYTASAPVPPEVVTLFQLWGVNLKENYGQTEMVGGNLAQVSDWSRPGNSGVPLDDAAWETRVLPDGEMIVRGPGLFIGYWNKEAETNSALRDGWLHTGDIVDVGADGSYKLIDRKKELINTAAGKSISPVQIENELRESPYITEAMVIGEGRKYLTALIEVDGTLTMDWARTRDASVTRYADLATSAIVIDLIRAEVEKANAKLARAEQIKAFRILPEELTPENGVMTATRKKRRKPLMARYESIIAGLYDDAEEQLIKEQLAGSGPAASVHQQ